MLMKCKFTDYQIFCKVNLVGYIDGSLILNNLNLDIYCYKNSKEIKLPSNRLIPC